MHYSTPVYPTKKGHIYIWSCVEFDASWWEQKERSNTSTVLAKTQARRIYWRKSRWMPPPTLSWMRTWIRTRRRLVMKQNRIILGEETLIFQGNMCDYSNNNEKSKETETNNPFLSANIIGIINDCTKLTTRKCGHDNYSSLLVW